jgi:hypothetical protein
MSLSHILSCCHAKGQAHYFLTQKNGAMKKSFFMILFSFVYLSLLAQQPTNYNGFKWQAVLREDGSLVETGTFTVQAVILQDTSGNGDWEAIYEETHDNIGISSFGQISLNIGSGYADPDHLSFEKIPWGEKKHDLRIAMTRIDDGEVMNFAPSPILMPPFSRDNFWKKVNDNLFYDNGKVGIGTMSPSSRFHIKSEDPDLKLDFDNDFMQGSSEILFSQNDKVHADISWRRSSNQLVARFDRQNTGIGQFRIQKGDINYFVMNNEGHIGIGITGAQSRLHVRDPENVDARFTGGGTLIVGDVPGFNLVFDPNEIMAREGGNKTPLYLQNNGGDLYIQGNEDGSSSRVGIGVNERNIDPDAILEVEGMTVTTSLKITGGSDIKEDLNSIESLEPGDVVVLDELHPGKIRKTKQEYDKKVAGIISGANGVNPGLSLSQKDILEGDYPLTMLGRVYVKVTGEVQIGDMLTTSSKTGFAMAVKDYSLAHGAVIGKAMTNNETGDGLVLVLVNLQ